MQVLYGQLYEREWGTMIPIYNKPVKPFSPIRNITNIPYVTEVNPQNGNLYVIGEYGNEIIEYNRKDGSSKLIYKIPEVEAKSYINNLKFDSNNNIIFCGITLNPDLAAKATYSSRPIQIPFSKGYSYIAKIDLKGNLKWLSYFYAIPRNTLSITIDKKDNIYVLNKRPKDENLLTPAFQKKGDINSNIPYQDVITKLNGRGKHKWSTFYSQDGSLINGIMASDKGIYVYGTHLSNNPSSNYFGTSDSFMETTSGKVNNTSMVFLSKFGFDGERIWSTYFGDQKSEIPYPINNIGANYNNIAVINDDVYFITSHNNNRNISQKRNNLATNDVFLDKPLFSTENYTLSKFSGNGDRKWTTYLHLPGFLFKSTDNSKLFISTTSYDKNTYHSLVTQDSNQLKRQGTQDVYTYTLSLDGKKVEYETFYGYEGNDVGYSIPTINGYYTIGYATNYSHKESLFATDKAILNEFTHIGGDIYVGNFLGYFSNIKRK